MAANSLDQGLARREAARLGWRESILERFRLAPVVVGLAGVWLFFTIYNPVFLTPRNINFLTLQVSVTAVLALGLSFVLLVGEIDLSIAVQAALTAAIAGILIVAKVPTPVAIAVAIGVALVIASIHAFLVTRFRVPSFIVTLGTMTFMQGLLIVILPEQTRAVSLINTDLGQMSITYILPVAALVLLAGGLIVAGAVRVRDVKRAAALGMTTRTLKDALLPVMATAVPGMILIAIFGAYKGVPLFAFLVVLLYVAAGYLMQWTSLGFHIRAVGGNREATARSGIAVHRVKLFAFAATSTLAAVAGLIAASRTYQVSIASAAPSLMLNSIAACVIGGISLNGGRGSTWGVIIGAILMGSISNGLFLNGAEDWAVSMIQGFVLVAALCLNAVAARRPGQTREL